MDLSFSRHELLSFAAVLKRDIRKVDENRDENTLQAVLR